MIPDEGRNTGQFRRSSMQMWCLAVRCPPSTIFCPSSQKGFVVFGESILTDDLPAVFKR